MFAFGAEEGAGAAGMVSLDIRRALLNENPIKPVAGSFAGIGVGVGAGVGWGPGFGHANVGMVGAGVGAGVLVGYVLCGAGFGFGVPYDDCRIPLVGDAFRALQRITSARGGVSSVMPHGTTPPHAEDSP